MQINSTRLLRRFVSHSGVRFLKMETRTALILGAYTPENKNAPTLCSDDLTPNTTVISEKTNGSLMKQLKCSKPPKLGGTRNMYGLLEDFPLTTVVGLGKRDATVNTNENWDEGRENVRQAVAAGVQALTADGATDIQIDGCKYPDAAAEGAILSTFAYDDNKKADARTPPPKLSLFTLNASQSKSDIELFARGMLFGECQNIARRLAEMPCNMLTPTLFAEEAKRLLKHATVIARDEAWARKKGMHSFLSVNAGSATPAVFLETHVEPEKDTGLAPIVLVGKGVCFDTGGISIKGSAAMDEMRADMMGAACVLASAHALSTMKGSLKRKLIVLTPLVENCVSATATKPGDIVKAMNGKSIKIDNTDAEGRLILADALCYADEFKPDVVVDVATLTGAIRIALGAGASAVFTSDDKLWADIYNASIKSGDRVWRMPLWKCYTDKMTKTPYADLCNIAVPINSGGGSCLAAAFLKEFTECKSWAHIDIAGVMCGDSALAYCKSGMTGRPTRTLIEWLLNYDK